MAEAFGIVAGCIQIVPTAWKVFDFFNSLKEAPEEMEEMMSTMHDIERDLKNADSVLARRACNGVPSVLKEDEDRNLQSISSSTASIQTTLEKMIKKVYGNDKADSSSRVERHIRAAKHVMRRQSFTRLQDKLQIHLTKLQTSLMLLKILDASVLEPAMIGSQVEILGFLGRMEGLLRDLSRQQSKAVRVQRNSVLRVRRSSQEIIDSPLSEPDATSGCLAETELEGLTRLASNDEDVRFRVDSRSRRGNSRETMNVSISPMLAEKLLALLSNLVSQQCDRSQDTFRVQTQRFSRDRRLESDSGTVEAQWVACGSPPLPEASHNNRLQHDRDRSLEIIKHVDRSDDVLQLQNLLKDKSVDVNIRDQHGNNAILTAVKRQRPEMVQLLLEKEADILEPFDANDTVLHLAVQSIATARDEDAESRSNKCVSILLKDIQAVGLVDARNSNAQTALHWAVKNGWTSQVKVLLTGPTRANSGIRDSNGKTAFQLALDQGDRPHAKHIVNFILDYQPAQDIKGLTAAQCESLKKHKERRKEEFERTRSESISLPEPSNKSDQPASFIRRMSDTILLTSQKKERFHWDSDNTGSYLNRAKLGNGRWRSRVPL